MQGYRENLQPNSQKLRSGKAVLTIVAMIVAFLLLMGIHSAVYYLFYVPFHYFRGDLSELYIPGKHYMIDLAGILIPFLILSLSLLFRKQREQQQR